MKNNFYYNLVRLLKDSIPECYLKRLSNNKDNKSLIMDISKPNRQKIKEEIDKQLNSMR